MNSSSLSNRNVKPPLLEYHDLFALPNLTDGQAQRLMEILKAVVLEYANLICLPSLTDEQSDQLIEILSLAQENDVLNNWLTELDHASGHALGYLECENRRAYKDYCALLKERCFHTQPQEWKDYQENCLFMEEHNNSPVRKIAPQGSVESDPQDLVESGTDPSVRY